MKITYNETEKSIEIKDGIKSQYNLYKILIIINITNMLLNIHDVNITGFDKRKVIWVFIGGISLVTLFVIIFQKSTQQKIPIKSIKNLKQKSFLGANRFSIKLSNKKTRHLPFMHTQAEFNDLKVLIANSRKHTEPPTPQM